MKNDARLLLNKKKWKKSGGQKIEPSWRSHDVKSRISVDARKILNLKRNKKSRVQPSLGSYMRIKTASDAIAQQIKKEILPQTKLSGKHVQLSKDGNLIITSKPKTSGISMEWESSDTDDLEHTALEDLLDINSLPSTYVPPKTVQTANLSRKSSLSKILDMKNTMVADQLSEQSTYPTDVKIYVSNLQPSVTLSDVMELFGEVGAITDVEMLKPGTAVVSFLDENDAKKACELYHNRLLDGQPMKCFIQVDQRLHKSNISQRLGNKLFTASSPEEKTVTKSVLVNPRSRYNPRNVQFTVKLT